MPKNQGSPSDLSSPHLDLLWVILGVLKEHKSCQRPLLEAPITLKHTPIFNGDHVLMTETSPWED